MIGRTLSHFRILERIGAGGMGEVYRARDEHLDREVAIKVLPAGTLADEQARKRFRREAMALSKLNHPHIATVFDFDTEDGVDFLVMELVEGTTLEEKLRDGPLPEAEVSKLASQVADALVEAFERGVVHRDLKPGNIALTLKGQVKVLDFGLAMLVRPANEPVTGESLTQTQVIAGTLPYMAPEQLRGAAPDHRSDTYSLGVVLYEAATGRRPFESQIATVLSDDILHQAPTPPSKLAPSLTRHMEDVILKCLQKDPSQRYASAQALFQDLEGLQTRGTSFGVSAPRWTRKSSARILGAALLVVLLAAGLGYLARKRLAPEVVPGRQKIMLAVLPFENLGADPDQEYFSDGLTEEMIAHLGRMHPSGLGVIARTSVMRYKDTRITLEEIGRKLKVKYVLEGSVRRAANRVRITAQLIQISDKTHLWADTYEREVADVFAIQTDVSERVAEALAVELVPERRRALARASTSDSEAYEAYLQARYYLGKRTPENLKRSLKFAERAIERDADYALAYAVLADTYTLLGNYGVLPHDETKPKARAAALKAVYLGDSFAETHTSLAAVLNDSKDWSGAEKAFQRAIELNPNYALAHQWYANVLAMLGRVDEAIQEIERARELDPLSLIVSASAGRHLYLSRQYDRAIEHLKATLAMDESFARTHWWLGWSYLQRGMYEEALSQLQEAAALSGGDAQYLGALGHAYAVAGKTDEARKILDELQESLTSGNAQPFELALIHIGLDEKDRAFEWLERAYDAQDFYFFFLKVEPRLDPLRSDPRFEDLLRRLNLHDS